MSSAARSGVVSKAWIAVIAMALLTAAPAAKRELSLANAMLKLNPGNRDRGIKAALAVDPVASDRLGHPGTSGEQLEHVTEYPQMHRNLTCGACKK